ncbi:MAG: hypothetical protein CO149_07495, partial [Nitrospirae bacterium CG_4_9_14_3_um_filter_51_5]
MSRGHKLFGHKNANYFPMKNSRQSSSTGTRSSSKAYPQHMTSHKTRDQKLWGGRF